MMQAGDPTTIKRYAGRRLYHPALGVYVTIDDLAAMVDDNDEFVVRDAETGDDVTQLVLKQIIVERGNHG